MGTPVNPTNDILIERHQNNFDFLRFVGAFLVILAHCFSLTTGSTPVFGGLGLGLLGVSIFFIISGYLVAKSWDKNRSVIRFFYNRLLRLIPALAGACVFIVLIIGPLLTTLPLWSYLTSIDTYSFFSTISILFQQRTLPGVLDGADVNGQLWTLSYELYCYIFLAVLGMVGLLYRRFALYFVILISFMVIIIFNLKFHSDWVWNFVYIFAFFLIFFCSGSVYYLKFDKKIFNLKILSVLIFIGMLFFSLGLFRYILYLLLPYLVLYIAFLPIPLVNSFGNSGDYSYGLYIYGYPIQLTIVYYLGSIPIIEMLLISLICIFPMAFLSWHGIEKRALSLKRIPIEKHIRFKQRPE